MVTSYVYFLRKVSCCDDAYSGPDPAGLVAIGLFLRPRSSLCTAMDVLSVILLPGWLASRTAPLEDLGGRAAARPVTGQAFVPRQLGIVTPDPTLTERRMWPDRPPFPGTWAWRQRWDSVAYQCLSSETQGRHAKHNGTGRIEEIIFVVYMILFIQTRCPPVTPVRGAFQCPAKDTQEVYSVSKRTVS
jgi:hypothetical protein